MINLMLPEDKKILTAEYRRRIFFGYGTAVGFLLIIAIVAVSSFYAALRIDKASLEHQLEMEKNGMDTKGIDLYASRVVKANKMMDLLTSDNNNLHLASALLDRIIAAKPSGISLTSLEVQTVEDQKHSLVIRGRSSQRKNITDFIARLKGDPLFISVDSPFANLIKDTNSEFVMTIALSSEVNLQNYAQQ